MKEMLHSADSFTTLPLDTHVMSMVRLVQVNLLGLHFLHHKHEITISWTHLLPISAKGASID